MNLKYLEIDIRNIYIPTTTAYNIIFKSASRLLEVQLSVCIEDFFEKENIFSENYINIDILLATKLDVTEESFPYGLEHLVVVFIEILTAF